MGLIKNQNKRLYPQTIIIFKRNFLKALIVGKSATGKLSFWSCKKQLLKTDTRVMIYLKAPPRKTKALKIGQECAIIKA